MGETLTQTLIEEHLTVLGTSTDIANEFAFNFTLQGFEPIILAIPLDSSGDKITGEGTAGFSSNILIPEPTTFAILSIGALSLIRRKK
jgi:hypothetical protein